MIHLLEVGHFHFRGLKVPVHCCDAAWAPADDLYVVTEEEQICLRLPPTPVARTLANGSGPQWRRPAGLEAARPVRETTVSGAAGSQDSIDDRGMMNTLTKRDPQESGRPPQYIAGEV